MMQRWYKLVWLGSLLLGLCGLPLQAQDYGARLGTIQRGGAVSFEPTGPGVLFDALDPTVHKWYVPQELYNEYQWKQWEYSNYARQQYQRYVSTALEGEYFYDVYGNFLTRGWLIYDWQQNSPQPFGNSLAKNFQYAAWFSRLVVAGDHKGQYHYAVTLGDSIRTGLTPSTFSKPQFNGIQWDFASDKYRATMLMSRINDPQGTSGQPKQLTDNTVLLGGRVEAQIGDAVVVGGTLVNAHHSFSRAEGFSDNLLKGNLLGVQNAAPVSVVVVRISDDSPDDGEGGGALFASDIVVWDLDGKQTRGSEIGFRALIEGGIQRRGYLAADGTETITLRFNLFDPSYTGPEPSRIGRMRIELVLANDYRVEVASDRQVVPYTTNLDFLPVVQAPGDVRDGSNQQVVAFDYGLPTANQVLGFTVALKDLGGFDGYLEMDRNQQYRKLPNPRLQQQQAFSTSAGAWIFELSRTTYPYFGRLEAFNTSPDYTTSFAVVGADGQLSYTSPIQRYEFVDDNDDQDRRPDWKRMGSLAGDTEVFPGWDENNDLISDFNENDNLLSPNLIPDYEEPFLRLRADRPEYLYGVDMNHNQWVDRFENDDQPDYPYHRDQKGYNLYAGAFLSPEMRLTVGQERVRQISDDRRNLATYGLLTADVQTGWGRVRVYQDLSKVHDTIRDDLTQWLQPPNTRGDLYPVPDVLPAQNTWVNTTWVGAEWTRIPRLRLESKGKWQLYWQRDDQRQLALRGQRPKSSFTGLITRAEYRIDLGRLSLRPAWKSEFRRQTPVLQQDYPRRELTELLAVLGSLPVMQRSRLEGGVEYCLFDQMRRPTPPGAEDSYRQIVAAGQLTTLTDYLGYQLSTVLGLELSRRTSGGVVVQTNTKGYMTVYAGVQK